MSCHVCGMWIEIYYVDAALTKEDVMPRMWHVD